jgi:hypothetical protein
MKMKPSTLEQVELPDPPLEQKDLPEVRPSISQNSLAAYLSAKQRFQVARADYEKKRANLAIHLLQLCDCEPGAIQASLENGGNRLVVIDRSSDPPEIIEENW